jgi:hypothetical protein
MTYQDLPEDVRRFILTSVPSVPYLEAILLLRGAPQTPWTAASVARRLYLPESAAAELLRALAGAGIARAAPESAQAFHYAPATPELAAMLDRVAGAFSANLVKVTDLIHSRVEKRAQQFADAFRWRKDS